MELSWLLLIWGVGLFLIFWLDIRDKIIRGFWDVNEKLKQIIEENRRR